MPPSPTDRLVADIAKKLGPDGRQLLAIARRVMRGPSLSGAIHCAQAVLAPHHPTVHHSPKAHEMGHKAY